MVWDSGFWRARATGDESVHYDVLGFTPDIAEFKRFVDGVEPRNSRVNDVPEDVFTGIQCACDRSMFTWESRVRAVVHIADAPAHGRIYQVRRPGLCLEA